MKYKPASPRPDTLRPSDLLYVFRPRINDGCLYLEVELSFKGSGTGESGIRLPSQWARQKRLYDGIKNLRAVSSRTTVTDTHEPQIKLVKHSRGRRVAIKYEVHQDGADDLSEQGRYFPPILQKEYFHFIGEAVFIHPVCDVSKSRQITLSWRGLPSGWKFSNSFATNKRFQVISRPISQLRHAIYVGGDFRTKWLVVNKTPVYVAMRGEWKFSDEAYFGQ